MDSLTQIILGGAVGEAVLGKKVGNKAILWGAIGGTIPDLDTIPGQFVDTVSRLEIHRGFSHSIVFAFLISPLLGWLIHQIYRKKKEANWWAWTQLFFWTIFTHPLLDIFTTWGTQLFWPFDWRIAIQSIFVIDPIYTIPFLVCLALVLFIKKESKWRRRINRIGLLISSGYLLVTVIIKVYVDQHIEKAIENQLSEYKRFESRPTAFNAILWTANIETEKSFLITYYSLLDQSDKLNYIEIPKQPHLLYAYRNNDKVERLIKLTKGYYTIQETNDGVAMNDLRFGLVNGFNNIDHEFVFTYLIKESDNGIIVEEKQRSFDGMEEVMHSLWERLKGN